MPENVFVIDPNGFLQTERKEKLKPLFCPLASPNMTIRCGDWCPHFREPIISDLASPRKGRITLTCQSGTVLEGLIFDQRYAYPVSPDVNTGAAPKEEPVKEEPAQSAVFPGVITIGR